MSGGSATELNGDGDGRVGSDEQIRISWSLSDPSGISAVTLLVGGASVAVNTNGGFGATLNPLSAGDHTATIVATDADESPASSTNQLSFRVLNAESLVAQYGGATLTNSGAVNLGEFILGNRPSGSVFTIRNTGEQMLTISNLTVSAGFALVQPSASRLEPGSSTVFTISPDTSRPGPVSGLVTIISSDGLHSRFSLSLTCSVVLRLSDPTILADGFRLTLFGASDHEFWIGVSTNLIEWTWLTTNELKCRWLTDVASGIPMVEVTDTNAMRFTRRFYRAKSGGAASMLPVIRSQPQSQTVAAGASATFRVEAAGTEPLTNQWRKDGADLSDGGRISGARTATLAIANCQASDAGSYDVVVSNAAGAVTSRGASLMIADLAPGLVAYYPFDGNANDESGNGYNGTVISTLPAKDRFGIGNHAYEFDGTSSQINIDGLTFANTSFSISFWSKRKSTPDNAFVLSHGRWGSRDSGIHVGYRGDGSFTFAFYLDDLNTKSDQSDFDGQWHSWMVTYDAASRARNIYKDGLPLVSDTSSGTYSASGTLRIGRAWDIGYFFNGFIDDVRIYDRALSVEDVAVLYAVENTPP